MSVQVEVLDDFRAVPREEWDRLLAACPDSTVFQSYGWIDAWIQAFGDDVHRQWIFAARQGGELVGVAPLWQGGGHRGSPRRSCVYFLGASHADYLTFPARGAAPQIVHALLDAIDCRLPRGVAVELSEVPQFSTLACCLAERAARRFAAVVLTGATPCPYLRIAGNDAMVDRVLRKQSLRRHRNGLKRLGEVTIQHLSARAYVEPLLEGFFEQHVRRWSGTAWPSLFRRPQNRAFYRALAAQLEGSGQLLFSVVRLDGRPVAQHFGLRSRDDLIWYKPTFDIEFGRCSPGEVLLGSLIEYAREQGLRALDFTRGYEPFKSRFCSDVSFNNSYLWARDRWHRAVTRIRHSTRGTAKRILAAARASRSLAGMEP